MNYIEVFKDDDICEIVGIRCNFSLGQVIEMGNDFMEYTAEELGINEDGIHFLMPVFHAAEYVEGGLVSGSYYGFSYLCKEINTAWG